MSSLVPNAVHATILTGFIIPYFIISQILMEA